MKIALLNGPNLNMMGERDPRMYGTTTLAQIETACEKLCKERGFELDFFQSNHEGALVDKVQESLDAAAIIINPGAYSHTSIALRDALEIIGAPIIEVHVSNIYSRETFRRHSYITEVATGVVAGLGTIGYRLAIDAAAELITKNK